MVTGMVKVVYILKAFDFMQNVFLAVNIGEL